MGVKADKRVYRVHGFTCAGCAKTFENNVKELPHVRDAQVNFGAAKLTVYGEASVEQLEQAGAFEDLKIIPDGSQRPNGGTPFANRKTTVRTAIAAALLIIGWIAGRWLADTPQAWLPAPIYGLSILVGGYTLFLKGLRNLARLTFDMNTLMTVAVLGAAAIEEWLEGAAVVVLFAISEALESYSMDQARQSIRSLMDVAPSEATVRRDGREIVVAAEDVRIGDVVIVKPGQKIPVDGVVRQGHSAVNQAAITGESTPVAKAPDDEVFAGTLNTEGVLDIETTKSAEDTAIAKIIHLVEEAQGQRAPSQAFVDRFARLYTPAIMLAALGVALLPPLLAGADWFEWIYRGLAVLVVGCPCALVISTPVAVVTAIGSAARTGVLIKGGIHLEQAGHVSVVAFDKTGTLTEGEPAVTEFEPLGGATAEECLKIAAALETNSLHPLARAIVSYAERMGVRPAETTDFASITGLGAKAAVGGTVYYIGSPALFETLSRGDGGAEAVDAIPEAVTARVSALQAQGKTVMLLGDGERLLALAAVADRIRAAARPAVGALAQLGVRKTAMLTGDNRAAAEHIAAQAGIDEVRAELMPQHKLEAIRVLQREHGRTAMVGDGVNDAPALAAADLGIAMGGAGSDTALETADIVIMADDLEKLPYTVRLSRKALGIIKQNIGFSLAVKAAALLLAIPGLLTLWLAVFADMGATLIVTLNALRLLRLSAKSKFQ